MAVSNQRPRTNIAPPKKESALITALIRSTRMLSYQPSAEMLLIKHGPFREISIAVIRGLFAIILGPGTSNKNKQYGPI